MNLRISSKTHYSRPVNNLSYHIGLSFLKLFGYLPFRILYFISDILFLIVKTYGYRKKIIYNNLKNSFPEKSEKEIKTITNKFYRHMSDVFVETFKIQSMSEAKMRQRFTVSNIKLLDKYYDEGRDVIAVLGHYGNWEWVPCINLFCKAQGCEVYHPLKNKAFDKFMLKLRSKWGTLNFPMKSVYRNIYQLKKENKRFVIGMISDQSPKRDMIQHYTRFLNQSTPVHLGTEKMAVKTNSPVVFIRIDKKKRGYYHLTVEPLFENPKDTKEFEITDVHTRHLEKIILEKPEYWLWSHKRWKFKDPKEINTESHA